MTPLRKLRQARQLTLTEVAAPCELDPANLSRIETLNQNATPAIAEKLVQFFGDGDPAKAGITELEILYPRRFMEPEEIESLERAAA